MTGNKRGEQHYEALDKFLDHARAGAPDEWIAEQSSIPLRYVRDWRNERGIKKSSGMIAAAEGQRFALAGLTANYEPSLHTAGNALNGDWQIPEYVLRVPMNYTVFARLVHHAKEELGMSYTDIAAGFGVRDQDVMDGITVWKRHLRMRGKKCAGCNAVIDTRFGEFCSRRCHDNDDAA